MSGTAKYMNNPIAEIVELIRANRFKRTDISALGSIVKELNILLDRAFRLPNINEITGIDGLNRDLMRKGIPYFIWVFCENDKAYFRLNYVKDRDLNESETDGSILTSFMEHYVSYLEKSGGFGDMSALETMRFRSIFTILYDWEYVPFYGSEYSKKESYDLETINLLLSARQKGYHVWYDKTTDNITIIRRVNW